MNRDQLIRAAADSSGLTLADTREALNGILGAIKDELAREGSEPIVLVGFGTFSVRERAARSGRNPATGETIQISASKNVGFKAGSALKDAVNN